MAVDRRLQKAAVAVGVLSLGLVCGWVNTHLEQPLFQMSIPVVLYLIVCPLGQVCGNGRPSVPKQGMKLNDGLLFSGREFSSLDVWPEVISPP